MILDTDKNPRGRYTVDNWYVNEVFGIKIQCFFHYMKQSKLKYLIRKKKFLSIFMRANFWLKGNNREKKRFIITYEIFLINREEEKVIIKYDANSRNH